MWRHVVPGDRIRFQAPLENAKRDAADAEQQRQQGEDFARPDRRREQDVVRNHNLSGVDLERGDAIGLGDPVIEPGDDLDSWYHRPVFKGELPLWQPQWKHPGRIGIMLEPCAANAVASAVVSGCVHARVKIRDTNHEYADVDWLAGGVRLTSTDAGAACLQLLAIEESEAGGGTCGTESDERWAYVRVQNGGAFTLVGKVVDRIPAFDCTSLCPPKGRVQVYYLNPSTECLVAVLDRQDNAIYVCPYNNECRPVAKDDWVRLHCDRWLVWWATPQEPVRAWLQAYTCIEPGSTSGAANVMKQGSAGYELDTAYPDPVLVDNTDCLIFAVPCEIFPARREGCCTANWIPDGTYGLQRRVRVEECLPCNGTATVTVLQSTCGGSGGDCGQGDSPCTISVCNTSGRSIAPCGPEEATAWLTPGVKATAKDCCWNLIAGPYPTRAKGTLAAKLCPADEEATVSGVTFPTFCGEWPTPDTAKNPFHLAGCEGKLVEMVPSFDCADEDEPCKWEIVQVEPKLVDEITADIRLECGESCTLDKKQLKQVLVWSCDETVCDATDTWEPVATGAMAEFMMSLECEEGESGECGSVKATYGSGCVFCPGGATSGDVLTLQRITYVDSVDGEAGTGCSTTLTPSRKSVCVVSCGSVTTEDAGNPVEISGGGGAVEAGDCIEVEEGTGEDGCPTYTVNNIMKVQGGDGVLVQQSDCTFTVSLLGGGADPKTTLSLLCGVEISPITITCVETSGGGWAFEVTGGELTQKFTELTLPSSLIEYTSECGGSGSGEEEEPVYSCDDCPACPEGQLRIMEIETGNCSCVAAATPQPDAPEGWIYCDVVPPTPPPPSGAGLSINGIVCDGTTPHVSFTFNGMPAGATSYVITATGDKGSGATIGPSFDHEEIPGQEYWGALNPGFGPPQPGEAFVFVAEFKDDAGNVVATQRFTATCPNSAATSGLWAITSVDCADNPNNTGAVGVTVNELPAGASRYFWRLTGGGCNTTKGNEPVIPGQDWPRLYYLVTYGTPQEGCDDGGFSPGHTYTMELVVEDAEGNIIATEARQFTCDGEVAG